MNRATFVKALEEKASLASPTSKALSPAEHRQQQKELSADPATFWQGSMIPDDWLQGSFERPTQTAALVTNLGKFPFLAWENPSQNPLPPSTTK